MRVLVRFKNKDLASYELEDESYTPPVGGSLKGTFFTIGKSKDTGKPIVVNLDEVVAFEPQGEDSGPWVG